MGLRILHLHHGTSFGRMLTNLYGIDSLAASIITLVNEFAVKSRSLGSMIDSQFVDLIMFLKFS